MTYKEKWESDHPGANFDIECECTYDNYGVPAADACIPEVKSICEECWNRVIPGTIDINKEKSMSTKKTKAELIDEIADLKKQVNELEKYETYRQCGDDLKAIHTEFMNAGFSNEQAFHLLQTMMQTSAMNNAIDTIKAVTRRR